MRYVNAEKVLPAELLKELRKHHIGLIYVPSDRRPYTETYAEVMRLHKKRLSTRDISSRVHLCPRRVRQIIRAAEAESAPRPDSSARRRRAADERKRR